MRVPLNAASALLHENRCALVRARVSLRVIVSQTEPGAAALCTARWYFAAVWPASCRASQLGCRFAVCQSPCVLLWPLLVSQCYEHCSSAFKALSSFFV